MDELSKRDFEALGCEDVPGPMLRARVFKLEGLVGELALSLGEMVDRFAPTNDGLSDSEMAAARRARENLATVRMRYNEDDRTPVPETFSPAQVAFLRSIGVRVEPHTNSDGTQNQAVFNDRANKAEARLEKLRENLRLIAAIDETADDHECRSFEPLKRPGAFCGGNPTAWHPREKTCSGTGWYRCVECVLYSERRGLAKEGD